MMIRLLTFIIVLLMSTLACSQNSIDQNIGENKIGGMTLVAPPQPFSIDPMPALARINVSWVAVVPYSFTPNNQSRVFFGNNHQWWGETPEGAEETIKLARKNKLSVMLKPQVWLHGSWIGDMDYDTEREWNQWESDYKDYILTHAHIAEKHDVELLCIGTEIRQSTNKRENFWRELIEEIRKIYNGKITYCANWDDFENIGFWDALDYIGISAYFPLSDKPNPTIIELRKAWNPIKKKLKNAYLRHGKQILFTEYGYLSVDGCTGKTWELEKIRWQLPTNELAQSNAIESLLSSFCDENYWAGGFMWKWYPFDSHRKGRRSNDYTPQEKLAEKTIKKWYGDFSETKTNDEK